VRPKQREEPGGRGIRPIRGIEGIPACRGGMRGLLRRVLSETGENVAITSFVESRRDFTFIGS